MALVRSPRWGRFFVIESRFFVNEKRDCRLRPPLRCRRAAIEKLGNGYDKLGWRERLGQKEAVRDAMRGPLVGTGAGARHRHQRRAARFQGGAMVLISTTATTA